MKKWAYLIFAVLVLAGGYRAVRFWTRPFGSVSAKTVFYEVHPKTSAQSIAKDLEKLGIVSSARLFYLYGRVTGKNKRIKVGDYRFTSKMKPSEVMDVLMSGISFGYPVTIP